MLRKDIEPHEGAPVVWIWRAPLIVPPAHQATLLGCLSADERERAGLLYRAEDRARFIVARARLRQILASVVQSGEGVPPPASALADESLAARLVFAYGPHGKPSLPAAPDLQFSLAHAGDLALIALTRGTPLGVDLEATREIPNPAELASTVFDLDALAIWQALDPPERQLALLRAWARKEAFLKAVGGGLAIPPSRIHVGVQPHFATARLRLPSIAGSPAQWTALDLHAGASYVAALAIAASHVTLIWRSIPAQEGSPSAHHSRR